VTGLSGTNGVQLDRSSIRARWIIGADGRDSRIRHWAGLGAGRFHGSGRRFGFRRHFEIAQEPSHVEVHWAAGFQVFVTPIGPKEVNVAVTTRDSSFRLHHALAKLPALRERLGKPASREMGAPTGATILPSIVAGNVTLVGDASGAVDSITGQGLNLAFGEAQSLVRAAATGDLQQYAREHRMMTAVPRRIAGALLLLADHPWLRRGVLRGLSAQPWVFNHMLAAHANACASNGGAAAKRRTT
jgi:2-polyprenyl-6-methoxyphenol hydroxylase-like FAD-dependent oxidoreductase